MWWYLFPIYPYRICATVLSLNVPPDPPHCVFFHAATVAAVTAAAAIAATAASTNVAIAATTTATATAAAAPTSTAISTTTIVAPTATDTAAPQLTVATPQPRTLLRRALEAGRLGHGDG